ncbi:MAG: PIN domain nuclease [Candidatus Cloacimonadota bacterium]|nr:MAG: PIN domain nuclease [Candidatus Cloacimonadota bacterium]
MRIIVDTSVWSLALRRKEAKLNNSEILIVDELIELIKESRVVLIGPIRQEILSGIVSKVQFNKLKKKLNAFEDFFINQNDYETASEFFNDCRKNGIQGSHIDFLICAVSHNNDFSIFTTDKDFENYSKHINIQLHKTREH